MTCSALCFKQVPLSVTVGLPAPRPWSLVPSPVEAQGSWENQLILGLGQGMYEMHVRRLHTCV